jgi:hypothetical protein
VCLKRVLVSGDARRAFSARSFDLCEIAGRLGASERVNRAALLRRDRGALSDFARGLAPLNTDFMVIAPAIWSAR